MLIPANPRAGDRCTVDGLDWVWIPQDVERGHWLALDGSAASVFPASDGIDEVHVYAMDGGREHLALRLLPDKLEAAFRFAAEHLKRCAN